MPEPTRVTADLLRAWPLPEPGSDKESRGVVLVVGGNRGTPGAVILSGEAALRVGGGKLQVATAAMTSAQVGLALPEALVAGLPDDDSGDLSTTAAGDILGLAEGAATVLLGPGLMDPDSASELLAAVVPELDGPVVVDALGSAYVTHHPDGLHHLAGRCVLTVNPNELARTLRVDDTEVEDDPVEATARLAMQARAVVLCGGPRKIVATPDGETWQVLEGGPGLGIAGSGDVQAGFVAGLLARGAEPAQAAVWAGFLHATAGDRLAEEVGPLGFLARELPAVAPRLLADLSD
ncbi:MAG: NAD(P)H-hydrate dehydratase [Nocardioides sp.]